MKTGIFCIGAAALAGLASARPSQHHVHEHLHEKRDVVTDWTYVTASGPDVIVYVDQNGNPISTSTVGQAPPTSTPSSVSSLPVSTSASVGVAAVTSASSATSSAAATTSSAASSVKSSATRSAASSAASASSSSSSGSGSFGYGISYSPYSGSVSANDVGCKTAAEVASDFEQINGYDVVRIYGVDCNQVANVLAAAIPKGMKVFAGVYDITQVESEIATIVSAADGNWTNFHTISVGNELVNAGTASASAVVAAIGSARSALSAAGMPSSVKVVTVDTSGAVMSNPSLCENSDYAAVNAHPFFDSDIDMANAGEWLVGQMQAVSAACGGKDTVVTETGWPTAGDSNGNAVPSTANQKTVLSSIKSAVSSNVVMFTAFNDLWKQPGYLNVEQSWVILN